MKISVLLILAFMLPPPSFKESQLRHSRVKDAYDEKERTVKNHFKEARLPYTNFQLFIQAFKKEEILEVWVKPERVEKFSLLCTYNFCASSGSLGPKRKEGDLQIPEGIYSIQHFNPQSNFHLSLGINYPNAADKVFSDKKHPGSAIYIHGNCVTVGCIPITDDKIKELYILAIEARNNGQEKIPVHIFPTRMDNPSLLPLLEQHKKSTTLLNFWKNLQPVYMDFEKTRQLKAIKTDTHGQYVIE